MKAKSNEELCALIQNNDQNASKMLLIKNENLIYSLMNRFKYDLKEKEDIFSCCKIALINAAIKFDLSFNCLFVTYAVPIILGEIKRYFRENSLIHISRSIKDNYRIILKAQNELESQQKVVSIEEISNITKLSVEDILQALESHNIPSSMDENINNSDLTLSELVGGIDENEINRDLNLALDKLEPKERLIIELRYFEGYNQSEVAKRLFISQVQVSRIEKKILNKLKLLI